MQFYVRISANADGKFIHFLSSYFGHSNKNKLAEWEVEAATCLLHKEEMRTIQSQKTFKCQRPYRVFCLKKQVAKNSPIFVTCPHLELVNIANPAAGSFINHTRAHLQKVHPTWTVCLSVWLTCFYTEQTGLECCLGDPWLYSSGVWLR